MIRYADYSKKEIQQSRPDARTAASLRSQSAEQQLESLRVGLEDLARDRPQKAIDFFNISVSGTTEISLHHNFKSAVRFWVSDSKPGSAGSIGASPVVQRLTTGATPWTDLSTGSVLSIRVSNFTGIIAIRVEAAQ